MNYILIREVLIKQGNLATKFDIANFIAET